MSEELPIPRPPAAVRVGAARGLVRGCSAGCLFALRAARSGVIGFYNSNNLTYASSIAYYTLLSLFPFMLLVLSALSRVAFGPSGSPKQVLVQVISVAFPSRFEFVLMQIQSMASAPINLSVVGTLVTLWAAMGVFGAVTSAVNHAWGVPEDYSFLKHKLVAFVMMLGAGFLAVTALVLVGTVEVLEAHWFSGVVARFPYLHNFSGMVYRNLPTPLFILVVGLIYYFIPNAKVRLRDVWFGAILAGLLWRAAFSGFAWYVRDFSRFGIHGSIAAVVVFLIWVYLSAVILLYGCEVTASYARLRRSARSIEG